MIKCNQLRSLLSAIIFYASAFLCVQCHYTNLLLSDIKVLETQSFYGGNKDIPSLLKQIFGQDIQRINTLIDCQNHDSYTNNVNSIKRVIKESKESQRNNWFVVQILPFQEELALQNCRNQILVDTINDNYDILDLATASENRLPDNDKALESQVEIKSHINLFSFFPDITVEGTFAPKRSKENMYSGIKGIQVMRQGFGSIEILLLMVLVILALLGIGAFIFFKKRKNRNGGAHTHVHAQKKVEKQRFIPSSHTLSFDSHLDHSKHGLNEGKSSQKRALPALNTEDINQVLPKLFTPNFKGAGLKMDDGEKISAINDNMFNQIDSPKSVEDLESQTRRSAKNAPEDIDFNVEFSIIEPAKKTIADD